MTTESKETKVAEDDFFDSMVKEEGLRSRPLFVGASRTWTLENVSSLDSSPNKCHYSPVIILGGKSLKLQLFLGGGGQAPGYDPQLLNHVSIYVFAVSPPLTLRYQISIVSTPPPTNSSKASFPDDQRNNSYEPETITNSLASLTVDKPPVRSYSAASRGFKTFPDTANGWGFAYFLPKSQFAALCVNNTVTFELSIVFAIDMVHNTQVPIQISSPNSLSGDFQRLFNQAEFSDMTFKVDKMEIPAHWLVLCARVPYFKAMYTSKMVEKQTNVVEIVDISYNTFFHLVHWIYTAKLELPPVENGEVKVTDNQGKDMVGGLDEDIPPIQIFLQSQQKKTRQISLRGQRSAFVLDLYWAAHRYQVNDLVAHCEQWLADSVWLDNLLHRLVLGSILHSTPILQKVLSVAIQQPINSHFLQHHPDWKAVPSHLQQKLLSWCNHQRILSSQVDCAPSTPENLNHKRTTVPVMDPSSLKRSRLDSSLSPIPPPPPPLT